MEPLSYCCFPVLFVLVDNGNVSGLPEVCPFVQGHLGLVTRDKCIGLYNAKDWVLKMLQDEVADVSDGFCEELIVWKLHEKDLCFALGNLGHGFVWLTRLVDGVREDDAVDVGEVQGLA